MATVFLSYPVKNATNDEMIYGEEGLARILVDITVDRYRIVIVNFCGRHPNAYIKVPSDVHAKVVEYFNKEYDGIFDHLYDYINVNVHGGMTYDGRSLPEQYVYEDTNDGGWWYGWDYNHLGDFAYYGEDAKMPGKKWTVLEILDEAMDAIKQLKENYE